MYSLASQGKDAVLGKKYLNFTSRYLRTMDGPLKSESGQNAERSDSIYVTLAHRSLNKGPLFC